MDFVYAAEHYVQAAAAMAQYYAAIGNPNSNLVMASNPPPPPAPLPPSSSNGLSLESSGSQIREEEFDTKGSSRRRRRSSRDRSSSRRRRRSRSRDHRRDRSRRRRRRRSSTPPSDKSRKRDRSPPTSDDDIIPNNTIMLRGLAQHITENDIRADIANLGLMAATDIRLIRKKDSGGSRGFAFVEFNKVEDARKWMEAKQGVWIFKEQYRATMQYSFPRDGRPGDPPRILHDWICGQCGVQNFRRRDQCFKCGGPKTEDLGHSVDESSSQPTATVLLRGLDVLTTADDVLTHLMKVTDLPIKSIKISKEPITNMSRGICYVEMNSIFSATFLHNYLLGEPPLIDGKLISVSYYRGDKSSVSNLRSAAYVALEAAQWSNQDDQETSGSATRPPPHQSQPPNYSQEEIDKLAKYSASIYAKNKDEESSYYEYYKVYYQNKNNRSSLAKEALGSVTINGVDYKQYPEPNVSTYHYDETSGFYYDPCSSLYYDANSCYYYDSKSNGYLYWSSEHKTFLPVASQVQEQQQDKDKKNEKKESKVKSAKRIAKDMEKWAKTLNQRKDVSAASLSKGVHHSSTGVTESAPIPTSEPLSSTEDVAFSAMFQKQVTSSAPCFSGSGEDSDEIEDSSKHSDWENLTCLLCQRQFVSKEKLTKHNALSDLHKQNLVNWRKDNPKVLSIKVASCGGAYRDRALERRTKFRVVDESPQPNKLKEKYLRALESVDVVHSPEPSPITQKVGSENIGNQMLQKMGWKEGLGLGKSNQGRTSIIETNQRTSQAGLGSSASSCTNANNPNDSYKDCVKRTMYQRYHEMNN